MKNTIHTIKKEVGGAFNTVKNAIKNKVNDIKGKFNGRKPGEGSSVKPPSSEGYDPSSTTSSQPPYYTEDSYGSSSEPSVSDPAYTAGSDTYSPSTPDYAPWTPEDPAIPQGGWDSGVDEGRDLGSSVTPDESGSSTTTTYVISDINPRDAVN